MMTEVPSRKRFETQLAALVEKFSRRKDEYKRADYAELQARIDFIDPLFEALGWDVRNIQELPGRERQVIVESGQTSGRPDYNFRLNGQTQFFVEAKAPHVPLDTSRVILQAKKYAFNETSQMVMLAATTDFEEFRLYEVRDISYLRRVNKGLIFAYRYDEYLSPKALDDLWKLSRESVAAGSLDALITPAARRERQRIPLDRQFLSDLVEWRGKLAKAVFKAHPELDADDLNNVVQVFLDRLIFIRVAEDRGVLPENQLREIARHWTESGRSKSILAELLPLFRLVNQKLNGEIFKPHKCEEMKWDSALVAEIIDEGLEPYNFAQIGVELLGSIYERYLGKTIRVTETRAIVQEKPEVRKAGGVYYTPKYIVDYIVAQTVGKLIEGKAPKQIEKLRVLDPACGSGSFLLGAYQGLLDYHQRYYAERARSHGGGGSGGQVRLFRESGADYSEFKLTLEQKAQILRNNIYGVDIDPQAVEITMMSLYIKMLEGERGAITGQGVLPRLRDNVKCGNSLIGYDIGALSEVDKARINPFDWNSQSEGFGEIMAAGGFDAVIGNPPYGASFGEIEAEYFRKNYQTFSGVKDVYTCFMEAGIERLRKDGRFSFIVPSAWLGGPQYETLRSVLLHQRIEAVILLPFDVFPEAYVDTAVFVVSKNSNVASHEIQTHVYPKRVRIGNIELAQKDYKLVSQSVWSNAEGKKFVLDPGTVDLLVRIRKGASSTFGDVVQIKRGVLFDKGLLTPKKMGQNSYRYFEGDVYRYDLNLVADQWVEFSDRIRERPKEFIWFEGTRILLRRLVNRRQRLMATLASDTFITNKNLYSVLPKSSELNLLVVLGVLNSHLISHLYINQVTQATKDDFPQVTIKDLLALPFPSIADKARHDKMVALVEKMLDLHEQKQAAKSDAARERSEREIHVTDEQIDALVYELYGLTKEEIKLVEGK